MASRLGRDLNNDSNLDRQLHKASSWTEMDGKMKLVEDVTGEEVSEMHARSVLVGILDPVIRQHTAMNHSKSCEVLKKIVQEFATNSTTGQGAMQIELKQAPLRRRQPGRHQWHAMVQQQCWTCKGYGHVSRDCPSGKGKGKDNFGEGKGAYEWGMSNCDGNKGSNYGMYKGGGKANSPSSWGPVKVYKKGDGKSAGKGARCGKCDICSGDHFARDCPEGGGKGGLRASLGDLGRATTGRTHTCSVIATRGAYQARTSTASAARTEQEIHEETQPGIGTQEPRTKTARDWDPRTHEEKQWSRLSTFSASQVVIDIEEVVQIIYLKRISERIVELIVDDPVPQIWKRSSSW